MLLITEGLQEWEHVVIIIWQGLSLLHRKFSLSMTKITVEPWTCMRCAMHCQNRVMFLWFLPSRCLCRSFHARLGLHTNTCHAVCYVLQVSSMFQVWINCLCVMIYMKGMVTCFHVILFIVMSSLASTHPEWVAENLHHTTSPFKLTLFISTFTWYFVWHFTKLNCEGRKGGRSFLTLSPPPKGY